MSSSIQSSVVSEKPILYAKGAVQDPTIIGDCPFTQKARLGLASQGINDYILKLEDMTKKSAELLQANPKGTVPVWVYKDTIIADSEDILQQLCPDVVGSTTTQEREVIDNELKAFQSAWFATMKGTANPSTLMDAVKALNEVLATLPPTTNAKRITELQVKLCPLLYQYSIAGVHYRKLPPLPSQCSMMLSTIEKRPEWEATVEHQVEDLFREYATLLEVSQQQQRDTNNVSEESPYPELSDLLALLKRMWLRGPRQVARQVRYEGILVSNMNAFRVRHLENALLHFDKVKQHHTPVDMFLHRYFQAHRAINADDRAWISDHMYELFRWQGLIDHCTPKPVSTRGRLYTYLTSDRWRSNAQNRRLDPHIRTSMPKELFGRLADSLGTDKAVEVSSVLNERPVTFLRVNINQSSRSDMMKFLLSKEISVEKTATSPVGLVINDKKLLLDLPEYRSGAVEIQDESSQIMALQVVVLDYCAGSGGKSLVFGPNMQNTGHLYLHDVRDSMLRDARKRLRRAGIRNYTLLYPRHPTLHKMLLGKCDWVLCDVPCSRTGVLRRNPDAKWMYSDEKLFHFVALQREIVRNSLRYLKPKGGKLVYCTNSILDEENILQIQHLCRFHELVLSEEPMHAMPQSKGMDGFFSATLERKST
ncbi:RNA methyltransferase, putative [Perkinsus marinus ATCC 50983]|uniref:RNA methyltransferase, putative n=1 Tax=Perkinsus marinus (strain ATCC 50983 / TXsc) TaxID=423536 RepID=C5KNF9_PERM5|nr:RNA methyltransferase, putative [Perkinsus marinus ATCC 50983]EER13975.1 RNA methyltransferase, putative [Perkinsus marinus ATCC 50983]|eukprot:XP_002782180.1 RNA methyltransferase, putative [Perkinsus marinus ATCC 50983]